MYRNMEEHGIFQGKRTNMIWLELTHYVIGKGEEWSIGSCS